MAEGYPGYPNPHPNTPPHRPEQGPYTVSPHDVAPPAPSHFNEEEGTRVARPNDMRNVPMAPGQAGWGIDGQPIFRDAQQNIAYGDSYPAAPRHPGELQPHIGEFNRQDFGPTGEPTVLPQWNARHNVPDNPDARTAAAADQAAYDTDHNQAVDQRARETRQGIEETRYTRPGHTRQTDHERDIFGREV